MMQSVVRSLSDQLAPFGSHRLSVHDGRGLNTDVDPGPLAAPSAAAQTLSASADVHVCQLFHHNSSDKNLTLGVAESITLEALSSQPYTSPVTKARFAKGVEGSKAELLHHAVVTKEPVSLEDATQDHPQSYGSEEGRCSRRGLSKLRQKLAGEWEGIEEEEEEEEEEEDVGCVLRHGGSEPLLPNASLSGRGSSSTDLTCDCESPDNLSNTSLSSGHSHPVRVHHAPSLTYGLLSVLRAGKEVAGRKMQGYPRRQSRSLTDVNSLQMDSEVFDSDLACGHATVVQL